MLVKKLVNCNYNLLEERILSSKEELKKSKDLSESERKVLIYILSQLFDGVENHRFSTCCTDDRISFFEVQNSFHNVFVKMSFRNGSPIKAFSIENYEDFLKKVEYYSEAIGLIFKNTKTEKSLVTEFFWKG